MDRNFIFKNYLMFIWTRPLHATEKKHFESAVDIITEKKEVYNKQNGKTFTYDQIFAPTSNQVINNKKIIK